MSYSNEIPWEIIRSQRSFFESGETKSVDFRKTQLRRLLKLLVRHENDILEALKKDLKKHPFEAFSSEIGFLKLEITEAIQHLKSWTKRKRVSTPLVHFPASSYIVTQPLGQVLVISPWNYPIMLAFAPVISAIAAGNCVVLKPSELTPNCSALIKKLVADFFDAGLFTVIEGDGHVVLPAILENYRFDYVFFTGSESTGKIIYKLAAEKLTPVTLELGGKSPCIVDETADVEISAKRIVWSKFWNAGQTCVAPDYLLVHESVLVALVAKMKLFIEEFFGKDSQQSDSLSRIVSIRHFVRLKNLMNHEQIEFGGRNDESSLWIEPTLIMNASLESSVMKEEIFGPILPILTFKNLEEAMEIVRKMPDPLSLYIYSKSKKNIQRIEENLSYGGGVINGGLIHLANPKLPFGGVGRSGFGNYHGKFGFDTFSHQKAMMFNSFWPDIPFRYAPFGKWNWIVKQFMR
jgi:aldehyde dehydrogenase (NAD+)